MSLPGSSTKDFPVVAAPSCTMSQNHSDRPSRRETLDQYLPLEDLVPCKTPGDKEWRRVRLRALMDLLWHFSIGGKPRRSPRSLLADVLGFAWAGIYRSMVVPSIAAASFRNEGHFRPRERILGTENFFGDSLRYAKGHNRLRRAIQKVNLRHHVAGIVARKGDTVEVLPHYEAAFAYVSTAFIECIRDGYAACGVRRDSPKGHRIAADLCRILYPVAGMVGLTRMPRDLDAHDRFRDAFEAHIWELPRSRWMDSQVRQLAKRIFPFTAARSGISLETLLHRHLDRKTAQYLFPDPSALVELRPTYDDYVRKLESGTHSVLRMLWVQFTQPRVAPNNTGLEELWQAYRKAPDDSIGARMVGAVLENALEVNPSEAPWLAPATMHLDPGETLFRQGQTHHHCYLILESSGPLVVTRRGLPGMDPDAEVEVAQVVAPTLLGEIGMWRGRPAIATVGCRQAVQMRVLRLDTAAFNRLKEHSGFWHAVAAEVQQRLRISMTHLQQSLFQLDLPRDDQDFQAMLELVRYVNGEVGARLDRVPEVYPEISLAGCIDLLRQKASDLRKRLDGIPSARVALENLLDVIG